MIRKLAIALIALFFLGVVASVFTEESPQEEYGKISTNALNIDVTTNTPSSTRAPAPTAAPTTTISPQAYKAARARMTKTVDTFEGVTWLRHKTSPRYTNKNGFFLYIGYKDKSPWLRMRIQYYGDEWLFIESFEANVDGSRYPIDTDYFSIERDNDGYGVWEWLDRSPSTSDLNMMRAISKSKKAVIRISGDQYQKDVVITTEQKKAISDVFTVYEGLGGD
jgi:hypothetical protein